MSLISISTIITSIVLTGLTAIGGLFCTPLYNEIKSTVEVMLDPQSLNKYSETLEQLLADIAAMSGSDSVINNWIGDAKKLILQIDQLRQQENGSSNHNDDHQSGCLCGDACSRCCLRWQIKDMIDQGNKIKTPMLGQQAVDHIYDVPIIEEDTAVGRNLKQVMEMLKDDNVRYIGVWGPVGVGKSTLVKALNNKLESDSPFSLVRLVDLATNAKDEDVQKAIAKSLGLDEKSGESTDRKIHNTLQRKKFLLILDNVWSKPINLSRIGIPEGQMGSKIIFTTRFHGVCTKMAAQEIPMGYLKEEEAWRLFQEKAGKVVNDKRIEPLAKKVCEQCDGLPLALVIMGSAMQGESSTAAWEKAVRDTDVRHSAPTDASIESNVFNPLKLSYDSLDDTLKSCFLYCSLYPVGYSIEINELVECWLAEDLVDDQLFYADAYAVGLELINRLVESCLLEKSKTINAPGVEKVKMPDTIRDAARWIGKSIKKSVVYAGYGKSYRPVVTLEGEEAKNSQWVSFADNSKVILPECEKDYSSVTTLLFRRTSPSEKFKVSTEFLKGFRALKVLNMQGFQPFDASQLRLEELDALILRRTETEVVPTAKKLTILDLSHSTNLRNLPRGTKEFSNLRVLNLSSTSRLDRVDADTMCNLNYLEVLDMSGSGYKWPMRRRSEPNGQATLQDLASLQLLREVFLQLAEADGTYEECRWMERLKSFFLAYGNVAFRRRGAKAVGIFTNTKAGTFILHAKELFLFKIGNVNEVFADIPSIRPSIPFKLKKLHICSCGFDTSSTATANDIVALLHVEELHLRSNKAIASSSSSEGINAVSSTNEPKTSEQKVKWLSLKLLEVIDCPDLKKFPHMPSIEEIRGSAQWWDGVEWDSEETKSCMNQHFKPLLSETNTFDLESTVMQAFMMSHTHKATLRRRIFASKDKWTTSVIHQALRHKKRILTPNKHDI